MSSNGGQDPFSYLQSAWSEEIALLDSVSSMVGISSTVALMRQVNALPPEQRFTDLTSVLAEHFGIETADDADLAGEIPDAVPAGSELADRVPSVLLFLGDKIGDMERAAVDNAVSGGEHERDYLVLLAFLDELSLRLSELHHAATSDGSELTDELLSETMALQSWVVLAAAGEVDRFDERFLRAVFYARYYNAVRTGDDPQFEPEELGVEEMWRKLVIEGVLTVYTRRDISRRRGAELAGVSLDQFERLLDAAGVDPDSGPAGGGDSP